jgi:DNA-binding transcriptional LysR family regulator
MSAELRHLRCFVAVAEDLSFSAAARRLYLSQQALSRIVQQLEREVGVKLFDRTTRAVQLTPAGEAMLASARQSIAAATNAVEQARRVGRGEPVQRLRIDTSSAGLETGALVLRRLRRDQPRLPVEQVEDGVPRGLVNLQNGRLDALLGLATHCPVHVPSEVIRREPVLIGMAADHPLARLDVVPVAELADLELLLPSPEAATEWIELVEQFCDEAGVTPRRWPGVTHGQVAATEVLREHACVVPTPTWADPPTGLVFRPLVDPDPVLTWSLMTTPDSQDRPELDALQQCARAVVNEHDWLAKDDATHSPVPIPLP